MQKIAITMGDPAGIGPEIILKALQYVDVSNLLLIGNRDVFEKNEKICGIKLPENLEFFNIEYNASRIKQGIECACSGELSYLALKTACDFVNQGKVSSIATAPLSKNALSLAGYNYSGQTEILQKELGDNEHSAQMLFVAESLKILLLTRHLPLRDVAANITRENIINTFLILNAELKTKFKCPVPKIAMCALNPHAGENGLLGFEEIEIIDPAIQELRRKGVNAEGAFSADTLLGKAINEYKNAPYDAYVACYHDQALPAIKAIGLDKVLNITIGLKALRSSPSHGTAFDIAYQNKADYRSMLNAINFLQNLM